MRTAVPFRSLICQNGGRYKESSPEWGASYERIVRIIGAGQILPPVRKRKQRGSD